jgi:L-2-amino-thiazoline-4-carboxylic acid hydrolase
MPGSLNDILPDPISEENERVLLDHIKRKLHISAQIGVLLLRAMEDHFGPEARQVLHEMLSNLRPTPRADAGEPHADLQRFCALLDTGCAGTHCWERIVEEPDRISYHYTRCMWAEIYRELGEPDLGLMLCAGDEPAVKSYNPGLAFRRTQTLMTGDPLCDHIFFVEEQAPATQQSSLPADPTLPEIG